MSDWFDESDVEKAFDALHEHMRNSDGGTVTVEAMRAALSTVKPKGEWRPIGSAPKDGTIILGAWEKTWANGHIHVEAVSFEEGFWYFAYDGDSQADNPTHWMPLFPPAPTEE